MVESEAALTRLVATIIQQEARGPIRTKLIAWAALAMPLIQINRILSHSI